MLSVVEGEPMISRITEFIKTYVVTRRFFIVSAIVLLLYLLVPLLVMYVSTRMFTMPPGFGMLDYGFAVILALLFGLFASVKSVHRDKLNKGAFATSGVGGVVTAIAGTFSCPTCAAFLAALIGTGSINFLIKWKVLIGLLSVTFLIGAIYFSLRCANCEVPR